MATYSAADLLDQLMGPNRNLAPGEKPRSEVCWSDKNICKYYLCGFCPYELFINTKADLGSCPNVHDDVLKKQYDESDKYGKMGYEESFLHFINKILQDCEKKIQRGYDRLRNKKPVFQCIEDKETYDKLSEKINTMLKKVEDLGSKGLVEEAAQAMQTVEDLKCELNVCIQKASTNPKYGYDREMEVCAVCGSLTLVNDLPTRFEDHLNGRQHVGYAKIRMQVRLMTENQYWKNKQEEPKENGDRSPRERNKSHRRSKRSSSKDGTEPKSKSHRHSEGRSSGKHSRKSHSRSPKHRHRHSHKEDSPRKKHSSRSGRSDRHNDESRE